MQNEHREWELSLCPNESTGLKVHLSTPRPLCLTKPLNIFSIISIFRPQEPPKDGVISTYEEHEDSVYAVDWSTADPWVFASLSYDGRLVINRVPRAEKYKILL